MIPYTLTAGVTLAFQVNLTAYPAEDWSMTLHLRGPSTIDVIGASHLDSIHRFSEKATYTKNWKAGHYRYALIASRKLGDEVVEVDSGTLEIIPDLLAMADGTDTRSHAQKVLEAIEAVLEGRARKDQSKYKINNRELERTPLPDLLAFRKTYKAEVARELRKAKGLSPFQHVRVRFS
ncbi:hypothetical protein [Endozoicomonas acroporae]|uniref:hypothetical protein n=1 Tax=Endozoicomonas acroporae TaxID=1701104 RepID=UPI0013D8AB77|nr:hypothetical protein [Endozoicomonas acroporae]